MNQEKFCRGSSATLELIKLSYFLLNLGPDFGNDRRGGGGNDRREYLFSSHTRNFACVFLYTHAWIYSSNVNIIFCPISQKIARGGVNNDYGGGKSRGNGNFGGDRRGGGPARGGNDRGNDRGRPY